MLLQYFYDNALAHASYMVGCQKTGEALIVDPGRDIDGYLAAASRSDMRITAAADTHIHADYVSGARELAERCGAKLYLSDAGPAEWKYRFAGSYDHQLLKEGDRFFVGNVCLDVIHTPGHTPESLTYLLTDVGGGASGPMGVFTGDFVFVGSIGRPDLLEETAGMVGTAAAGAKDLYRSIQRFRELPDHLQVWPAHGAGSACGKGLGSIPTSTVGYEKRHNPALQFRSEDAFVDYILAEQPEAPTYFALMKRVNKEGPAILGAVSSPPELPPERLADTSTSNQVVDTRGGHAFANGYAAGTLNIPLKYLAAWAGWLVDYARPLYLIAPVEDRPEIVRVLNKIGVEQIGGFFSPVDLGDAGLLTRSYEERSPKEVEPRVRDGEVILIDVRGDGEWNEQHVPGAQRCFLAHLPQRLPEFAGNTLVFLCRSGGRSAIAASLALAAGVRHVFNLKGGIQAWARDGLAVNQGSPAFVGRGADASASEDTAPSRAVS